MPHQPYFVVVLAHSLHGRLRRVHIPHKAIYAVLALAVVGLLTVLGFLGSYARMSWKVSNYNNLRKEVDALRTRYRDLERVNHQKDSQLATLQVLATEVSVAYGIKGKAESTSEAGNAGLRPTYRETLGEYNFLQSASMSKIYRNYPRQWQTNIRPSLWPVTGTLLSPFGGRSDPFSGEGAIHSGVDIAAHSGTPIRVAADGIVAKAEWSGGYGKLVVVDHGSGMQTYYAHMSAFQVVPGQEIRRGDVVGLSGGTGRVTSPHLHFEVRMGGTPVNPYPFLATSAITLESKNKKDLPFE
ncbi:MAG: M23 family metallopeptidase [Acidobacteriota bacterium]|nr:M23 family metallopeptidase [Acidobacteriota bacterium]